MRVGLWVHACVHNMCMICACVHTYLSVGVHSNVQFNIIKYLSNCVSNRQLWHGCVFTV